MGKIISELLENIALPRMVRVRQQFPTTEIPDVASTLRDELRKPDITDRVKRGSKVAVAVGSRGMAEITRIVKVVVEEVKRCGAYPFIVPAMGRCQRPAN